MLLNKPNAAMRIEAVLKVFGRFRETVEIMGGYCYVGLYRIGSCESKESAKKDHELKEIERYQSYQILS